MDSENSSHDSESSSLSPPKNKAKNPKPNSPNTAGKALSSTGLRKLTTMQRWRSVSGQLGFKNDGETIVWLLRKAEPAIIAVTGKGACLDQNPVNAVVDPGTEDAVDLVMSPPLLLEYTTSHVSFCEATLLTQNQDMITQNNNEHNDNNNNNNSEEAAAAWAEPGTQLSSFEFDLSNFDMAFSINEVMNLLQPSPRQWNDNDDNNNEIDDNDDGEDEDE